MSDASSRLSATGGPPLGVFEGWYARNPSHSRIAAIAFENEDQNFVVFSA